MIEADLLPFILYILHTETHTLTGVMYELKNSSDGAENFILNTGFYAMRDSMKKLAIRISKITDADATIDPELLRNPQDLIDLQKFNFIKIEKSKWVISDRIKSFFSSQEPEEVKS